MSNPPRGKGTPRALYVAPPQRTGSASAKGSSTAQTTPVTHGASLQEATPSSEGSLASAVSPVATLFRVPSASEAFPIKSNSTVVPLSVKEVHSPTVHSRGTRKGQGNKQHSSGSTTRSFGVTIPGPATTALTDQTLSVVAACQCISSALSSNAEKAMALKELDASIRSSSLSALMSNFPPHVFPSLASSIPPLVFSASAGIRALALAVSDGLGHQKCPGWNPGVFLVACFQFLEACDSSNVQFIAQCLCFLISKCSSSWVEPNLSPCLLQIQHLADNIDNPQTLMHVIQIFIAASSKYPDTFKKHMKSVLKMLLGWCVDASIGLDASLQICHTIAHFTPVLILDPQLIQTAITKINVDLERACLLRSVEFRVPVLTVILCKLHECTNGVITAAECLKKFSLVLSSLAMCIDKCGIVGRSSICSSLVSLWCNSGLNQSQSSARILAIWLLCWDDESRDIDEEKLSLIVNSFFDSSQILHIEMADCQSTQPSLSSFLDPQQLFRTKRFFSIRSVWFLQCTHKGRLGQLMRALLLSLAYSYMSSSHGSIQFLESFAELADSRIESGLCHSRVASLQALLFPSTAYSAPPSVLLLNLLSCSSAYSRVSCSLLNNIITAISAKYRLQSSEFDSSGIESFEDIHCSISLLILLRDSEMHHLVEIFRIVSDTVSLIVFTVAATCLTASNSESSDAAAATISLLLQNVDDQVTGSCVTDVLNSGDCKLLDDQLVEAISQANLSHYLETKRSCLFQSSDRFYAKYLDHSIAAALLAIMEHHSLSKMSIGSLDAILMLLLQCCDGFGSVAAAAVSKHLLYVGILHCSRMNLKMANNAEVTGKSSRFAFLRRIFAAVGSTSTINGDGCSDKINLMNEPTPVSLLCCLWTLSSFSLCNLASSELAVLFCDALMYASFNVDFKDISSFSSMFEQTKHEHSVDCHVNSALSSDQVKTFMTYLSESSDISSSSSLKRADEIAPKIPVSLHSLLRNPSPREIAADVSRYVHTLENLSGNAATAIVAGRFRGSWGGAKEFFDWLTSVSQFRGDQPHHRLQQQFVSSLVCAIQRLSCAASKPVLSPQGVPTDASNLYFSQNYRTIENHCHRARATILARHHFFSPYDFHEHFKERLKMIVRSAASVDKKNAAAATSSSPSQFQIASRNSNTSMSSSLSPTEIAIQELETIVISAAQCSLLLISPEFSDCLMFAARSSAARISGVSSSFLNWTEVVSLMCLGSYEAAFEVSIQHLQFSSCSVSLRNLLIDCACTCTTRLLNTSLLSRLESTLNEEERLNSNNFALASAACTALSSWDASFDILQSMRAKNADFCDHPLAASGFSLGIMTCMSASVIAPPAAKEISSLSVAIALSMASSPNELSVVKHAMCDMALLNMVDSRQIPPNFRLFSHSNLWAVTLGQSALHSLHVEQKLSPLATSLKFVKSLRKHGCFSSAIKFMQNTNVLVPSRPQFLIEHFRCLVAVGGDTVIDALSSMLSLAYELRNHEPELSAKASLCANSIFICCDRSILSECSKMVRQEPSSLLFDSIKALSQISYPQRFLLNSIAISIDNFHSTFDDPLPSCLTATRSVSKYLTNLWFLLGSAAFRITSSIFHSSGNVSIQDDEHLLKFTSSEVPEFSKLSDREIMAAAIYAQNIWMEQVGNRFYHAIQPRSASEVDSCLRSVAENSNEHGSILSHSSLDLIFCCWKRVYSHQQQLASLASKSFLACLRCNVAKESTLLDVVLRLLRIIGCYSAGLDHILQDGLSTSPPTCWVRALPQLVAQLSHVNDRIAAFAGSLLSNIAREYPNRVMYTAVCSVGVDAADPVTSSREWRVVLKELEKQQPHAVTSIRRMASELLLLSVLPEEKLLASVSEIVSQLSVKMQQYTKEIERVTSVGNATSDMHAQRYLTVFRPLLISLEGALQTFIVDCSNNGSILTTHQGWLTRNILPSLKIAVESASSHMNLSDVSDNWKPLRSIGQKIQELIRRRSSIDLVSMSSALSGDFFACNHLPMPPTTSDASSNDVDVIISGIDPCIIVMRTKTLPKKIVFQSSVGSSKTFLLKGREDLNLDERMMQFVDVANLFFKDTLPTHSRDFVKARKYCVTPLSKRAGLIEWVNGCSSLMQLYEAGVSVRAAADIAAVATSSEQKQQSEARQTTPFKPVEHYTQQLQRALADAGINYRSVPRNQWPKEVIVKLYRQMAESAPRSVFHDALWSSSISSQQWWSRHVTFSRSLAVSSMIGYVIGLGDRHLDNILLDLRDGSVLHIDWNVCFEKGLRLAIPETVPFRLTPGLQYALGPGGSEGVFSSVATQCMEVLRDNRDILMTLLETFVHDPLLDWATALRTRRKRNALEVCVNFSLLAARLDELLDAAQIKELSCVRIDNCEDAEANIAVVAETQQHSKQVRNSQFDLLSVRYFVSAAATEVCLRQCRFSALKNLASSYSARLAPEKSKAGARLCRQDFMRLVMTAETKVAAFSDFLVSLQQPSTKKLIHSCFDMSRPSFPALPPPPSSWRIKSANYSSKRLSESEWIRLVAIAHQSFVSLDSAINELRECLLKYIDIVSTFSPATYASMTFSGEWSRLGRAVVSDQDNLDGRSAIMAFSSFTFNALLQTKKEVTKSLEMFQKNMTLASEEASSHFKELELACDMQERVSMPSVEVFDVFNSLRGVIETHPFEALSTTVGFLKQSIFQSCQNIPSLSECSDVASVGNCEWFCVVQKLYVPVVLTWLVVDSSAALAYLHNQSSMPLPFPCCTFCHGLQRSSLSEVIHDDALCDATFLLCKVWNVVSSSWLCLFSLSSQLAHQFSSLALAAPEIERIAAAVAVFAESEVSQESWLSFLRSQAENASSSVHILQTISAIYGWCTPLIDWFFGLHQSECLRSWLTCLVDVFSQLFSHSGADAFLFRINYVEKAFHTWLLKWIKLLFDHHNLPSRLSCLLDADAENVDLSSDVCIAIAADLNHRVNHSYATFYQCRKAEVEKNIQLQQQLFKQFLWTHAPFIQLKDMVCCPADVKDIESRLPLSVHNVQACLASFLSAHTNITSREESTTPKPSSNSGKQPEVVQRMSVVANIKDNATALLDLGKRVIELEQQRCHSHISVNWFGTSAGTVSSSTTQFLNSLAIWEAASVFSTGGLARVQEACDITSRALVVSEEAAASALSDLTAAEEAASRIEDVKSALQRAEPILSSLLRLLAHPAADLLLPSDIAANLKQQITEIVESDLHVDKLNIVIKKLCHIQQAVSHAASSLNDKDEVDEIQPNNEGASLAVKALRRIQKKLSGKDLVDSGLNAKLQVERAIDSSTNILLLARMYEGWTPWI